MEQNIYYLFLTLAILKLIVKVSLNYINIGFIKEKRSSIPSEFKESISISEHQKAADYTITKMHFSTVTLILHFIMLVVWIPLGGLNYLDHFVRDFGYSEAVSGLLFFTLLTLISTIITLPESLYSTFVIEEKYGFNKMTKGLFIKDKFKELLLSAAIGLPFLYVIIRIMQGLGNNWWFYAASFMLLFQFLMLWAYPKFIAPLFNKFTPLNNPELEEKLESLLQKCDLRFKDYYVMDASMRSSHGNAYFSGFGKNKRIVFFDTLLKSLENQEIISVLAHELGHLKHKHILKSLMISSVFLFLGFFILGLCYRSELFYSAHNIENVSTYICLSLFMYLIPVYTFWATPIMSWFSRRNEYEADKFAVDNAKGDALISALVKMYKDNSSTLTPSPIYSKFYFSHPPALERVEYIKSIDAH